MSSPASAASLSSCPQTQAQMKQRLDGGNANNWKVIDRSFGYAISWTLNAPHDVRVKGPKMGRFEWGGRADGSGIQYIWSSNTTTRTIMVNAGTFHCLGQRGGSAHPLTQFPSNATMAANKFGGNASNYHRIDRTGSSGWTVIANSGNSDGLVHMKTLPMGCVDYATNGTADHTCKGHEPPLRDRYTLWLLARSSDY